MNAAQIAKELTGPVNTVLLAMTYARDLREKIDTMHVDVLDYLDVRDAEDHRITNPKLSYQMAESYQATFYPELDKRIREMGYTVPAGHCPALIAEELQRKAEMVLVQAAEKFFPGMTWENILCAKNGLERLREYIDLSIKLVVNSPGYNPVKLAA